MKCRPGPTGPIGAPPVFAKLMHHASKFEQIQFNFLSNSSILLHESHSVYVS